VTGRDGLNSRPAFAWRRNFLAARPNARFARKSGLVAEAHPPANAWSANGLTSQSRNAKCNACFHAEGDRPPRRSPTSAFVALARAV
jgi:hypothetical protein